jgi:NAD(P)-dependent dehydrogenase (short-subunit alcohol dehydrogenase family)
MDRIKGKVAIVTGAAGGLGSAQASLLAKEGAKVVLTDIDETQGNKIAEEIGHEGSDAIFIKHDVSSEEDWEAVIEKTLSKFGKLDVLVNNAGVILFKNIKETTLEEWRWVIRVNLDGVFWEQNMRWKP